MPRGPHRIPLAEAARSTVILAALLANGCGYVGDPLPPLLNIPERVTDLTAVQRGSRIVVQFSVPRLTTEGMPIKKPVRIDLRAGMGGDPFQTDAWAATSKQLTPVKLENGKAYHEEPAGEWIGKEVVFGVNIIGANGRPSGWSNFAVLKVIPPLEVPAGIRLENVPQGVRLTWSGSGSFEVFRRPAGEQVWMKVARVDRPEWIDTDIEYGQTYQYQVQKIFDTRSGIAESERSAEVAITPQDVFPPAVPSGLKGVAGASTIELIWNRNMEPDLAGYRVYRAEPGAALQPIGEMRADPAWSDTQIQSGRKYRYAVSAVDQKGNESARSAEVEVTAP